MIGGPARVAALAGLCVGCATTPPPSATTIPGGATATVFAPKPLSEGPQPVRGAPTTAAERLASFQVFWERFREAALLNDPNRLADLSHFPFGVVVRVRGQPDNPYLIDGVVREEDRPYFVAHVQSWLASDPLDSMNPTTMHAVIDATPTVTAANLENEGVRVSNFYFHHFDDRGWRFCSADVDYRLLTAD